MQATGKTVCRPIVIRPRSGWRGADLRELWRYRELLGFLTWRDIKIRYKQTVLGCLWAFLQPFVKMLIFSLVFGRIARMDTGGVPYPIFVFAGLLPWEFFAEALSRSSQSVVGSGSIITKVYFPRLIVPLAAVGGCIADFLIAFLILIGLMVYYHVPPTVHLVAVVPLSLAATMAALGTGALVSALNVAYRDFRYVMHFLIQVWMFLTPVVYPVSVFSGPWKLLLSLNPMAGVVGGFRSAILGRPFDYQFIGLSLVAAVVVLMLGMLYFRRVERRFADII